jgi:tetratricopeptide (TPR) repeat protein
MGGQILKFAHHKGRILRFPGLVSTIACVVLSVCWVQAGQDPSQEVLIHFRTAQQAATAGELDRAAGEYKTVLTLDPTLVEARVNLGLIYHALGKYELAVVELGRALQVQPNLFPANLLIGIAYSKLGFTAKAVPPLERAVRAQPSNMEARRALAGCLLSEEDFKEATEQFRTLFRLEPDKQEAWYSLGHSYLEMATSLVNRMSTRHRSSAWTKRLTGDLQAEGGLMSLGDAVVSYRQALASESSQPGLHAQLGRVYLRQAKIDEAEQQFRNELQIDPHYEEALIGMAEAEMAKGEATAALQNISGIWAVFPPFLGEQQGFPSIDLLPELAAKLITDLDRQPEGPPRSFLLSALYRLAGEPRKAQQQLEAFQADLADWSGARPHPYPQEAAREACITRRYKACIDLLESKQNLNVVQEISLGKAHLRFDQNDLASDAFASALAKDPHNPESIYWLVRTYMKLASDCFTQLTGLFPDSWRTHELRGEDYRLHIQYKSAIKEYQIAASLKPDAAELHEELGDLYLRLNEGPLPEAKAELEKALDLDPSRARALYLLGRVCLVSREYETSITFLQKALRFDPSMLEARAELGKAFLHTGRPELAIGELEKVSSIDYYGNLHYQLYEAYRKLGKAELAQKALARSQELRKESVANQVAKVASVEPE